MKLLRTIRLDKSDTFVFARAAEPGEWATPGGFMFWDAPPDKLDGKDRAAFRSGFLGLGTFGWSTLAEVAEATPEAVEAAIDGLARVLVAEHGAPSLDAALAAADEEIAFSASLADHPLGTVIALMRSIDDDGSVRERFRTIKTVLEPGGNSFAQGCVLPIGITRDDDGTDTDAIEEVDLVGLMAGGSADDASRRRS
jgi:hypothetical protein